MLEVTRRLRAVCAIARDAKRPGPSYTKAVHFKDGLATAADGFALIRAKVGAMPAGVSWLVEAGPLRKALSALGEREVGCLGHGPAGTAAPLTLSAKAGKLDVPIAAGHYPDIDDVIARHTAAEPIARFAVDGELLARLLGSMNELARSRRTESALDGPVNVVSVEVRPREHEGTNQAITLRCRDAEGAEVFAMVMPVIVPAVAETAGDGEGGVMFEIRYRQTIRHPESLKERLNWSDAVDLAPDNLDVLGGWDNILATWERSYGTKTRDETDESARHLEFERPWAADATQTAITRIEIRGVGN